MFKVYRINPFKATVFGSWDRICLIHGDLSTESEQVIEPREITVIILLQKETCSEVGDFSQ